ncbi:MAG TPA: cob(I)yrinic acid a,c-diamide adenosyltransferase [Candidatus Woesearchaeota archaeon]|nr:cob(I)yrinic acid a,c-diamide adenosyltransferase [Candidatus Woesearchaeota archaeon]
MKRTGLVHIYTGDGKGKTTAALGLAVRARGAGLRVLVAQLFKRNSSEVSILKAEGIDYVHHPSEHPFFRKYSAKELKSEVKKCKSFIRDVFQRVQDERYDVVVLDEIGPALKTGFFEPDELKRFIKLRPENTELVMTGRGFPEEIIKLADYVTEMKMIKHPFLKGIRARKGVEY